MLDNMTRESLRELARNELKCRSGAWQEQSYQPQRIFDAMTRELIEAGYRALVKKHHPDVGGDLAKMQHLNLTMERIRREND